VLKVEINDKTYHFVHYKLSPSVDRLEISQHDKFILFELCASRSRMDAETVILKHMVSSSGSVPEEAIVKEVKKIAASMNDSTINKKAIKKILKKLVKSGKLSLVAGGEKKVYSLSVVSNSGRECCGPHHGSSAVDDEDNVSSKPLPFAEVLRRRQEAPHQTSSKVILDSNKEEEKESTEEVDDIDEEIRRLEAELNADQSDSDSDEEVVVDDDNDDHDDNLRPVNSDDPKCTTDEKAHVISLSTLASDRIEALPETALPYNKRRTLKGIDKVDDDRTSDEPKMKRRKKSSETSSSGNNISDGLRAAVKQVLDGYKPRSNEKIPFYCRVCARQYENDAEFFAHKKEEFHKAAVALEKKASYCKLCRKQLTSPVQLKEHLNSKPHNDRLQMMKIRQGGGPRKS